MLLMIGSTAMNFRIQQLTRKPRDMDLVGSYRDVMAYAKSYVDDTNRIVACYPIDDAKTQIVKYSSGQIIEASLAWDGSLAAEFLDLVSKDAASTVVGEFLVPSLDVLYMLKMSHRYLRNAPSFQKTMRDIQLMRRHGAKLPEAYADHYIRRQKEQYNYAHPKLNVNKTDFFKGDGVMYVYDHDSIHEAVKHLARPAYSYFKPDDSQVKVSRAMFEALPEETKLLSVLEEAYVLAIERSQVPYGDRMTPESSFQIAMNKVCTSITSGWWREFAWENYDTVYSMYSSNYVRRFWDAVENGTVALFNPEEAYA